MQCFGSTMAAVKAAGNVVMCDSRITVLVTKLLKKSGCVARKCPFWLHSGHWKHHWKCSNESLKTSADQQCLIIVCIFKQLQLNNSRNTQVVCGFQINQVPVFYSAVIVVNVTSQRFGQNPLTWAFLIIKYRYDKVQPHQQDESS